MPFQLGIKLVHDLERGLCSSKILPNGYKKEFQIFTDSRRKTVLAGMETGRLGFC